MVSWWSGLSNATDVVGANHGVLLNGTSFRSGAIGPGFYFTGSNQCVRIPYSASLATSNYTVEGWIQPTAGITDPTNQALIFGQNDGLVRLALRPGDADGSLRVALKFTSESLPEHEILSTQEIPVDRFTHVS